MAFLNLVIVIDHTAKGFAYDRKPDPVLDLGRKNKNRMITNDPRILNCFQTDQQFMNKQLKEIWKMKQIQHIHSLMNQPKKIERSNMNTEVDKAMRLLEEVQEILAPMLMKNQMYICYRRRTSQHTIC